jgi:hypothetical protein
MCFCWMGFWGESAMDQDLDFVGCVCFFFKQKIRLIWSQRRQLLSLIFLSVVMCFQSQDSRSVSHLVTVLAIVAGDWYQCSLASSTGEIFLDTQFFPRKKKDQSKRRILVAKNLENLVLEIDLWDKSNCTLFFVSCFFPCRLDCRLIENDLFRQDWRSRKRIEILQYIVVKWTSVFLVGLLTGIVAIGINLAVENVAGLKFVYTVNLMNTNR